LERTQLNNVGLGDESRVKWLQDRGYEAGLDEEGVKVRKPGDPTWGRIEPQGFLAGKGLLGKGAELIRDFTQDAGDEWASGVGTVKGAALGTLAGTPAGPVGAIGGGLLGAGAGAATVEAARRLAGRAAGFEESGGEFAAGVGEQGAYGAIAQGGGQLLGAGLKKAKGLFQGAAKEGVEQAPGLLARVGESMQKPQQWHEADVAYRGAQSAKHQTRAVRSADRAEQQAARLEGQAELQARTQNAEGTVDDAIAAGKTRIYEVLGENWQETAKRTIGTVERTGDDASMSLASEIARPDYGFLAKELEENPEVAHLLRKHFGEEFVPSKIEIGWVGDEINPIVAKRGSYAMAQREKRLAQLIKEWGPEETARRGKEYAKDISAYMLGHPEYAKGLLPEELQALGKAAAGYTDKQTIDTVMRTFSMRISGRTITPRLFQANRALEKSTLADMNAKTTQDEAMAARSQIYPDRPHRTLDRVVAGPVVRSLMGAAAGHAAIPIPGVGAVIGGLAVPALEAGGRKAMSGVGKVLVALGQPGGLQSVLQSAPPAVQGALETVGHALSTKGESAGKAALFIMVRQDQGLREWLAEQESEEQP
jgi:hypothetical protein